jgi:hypothetical protein
MKDKQRLSLIEIYNFHIRLSLFIKVADIELIRNKCNLRESILNLFS